MANRIWLVTGVSSGLGRHITERALRDGDVVVGTVRRRDSVTDLADEYPDTFRVVRLDVRETDALRECVNRVVSDFGRIDVVVSNAGYGLFGAAEEVTDEQIEAIITTNLLASIQLIRAVIPHLRAAGQGRIIQISSYGGQVAFAGNSLYHATKWGIEGFCESVAAELAPYGVGVTIVEPGGARTEFRYGSAQVAPSLQVYGGTPAHAFSTMLDPANGPTPGDPVWMAARIVESSRIEPAPRRLVLGSQALSTTIDTLQERIQGFRDQTDLAASTDCPPS